MVPTNPSWNYLEKLIFRFSFSLLGLFIVFFNNGAFPMYFLVIGLLNKIFAPLILWIGNDVLDLPYQVYLNPNGSGDTTFHYILLLCVAVCSIASTLIWTILDRKRRNYNQLLYWLTVGVRYYVAFMLIIYGLDKVIKLQFPSPSMARLLTTYGESSPMGLAWTFLGFSKGYNLFMGIAELAAGLLLFRRTVTIGAIITLMTTSNVMAVNYFYDVPVKIVSTALVVMCLFLLAPNFYRLFKLFFLGQSITLRTIMPPNFKNRWVNIAKNTLKYVSILFVLLGGLVSATTRSKIYGTNAPKSPLEGAYKVNRFTKNREVISETDNNKTRWSVFLFQGSERAAIKDGSGFEYFTLFTDTVSKKVKFTFSNDPNRVHELNYKKSGNKLLLFGKLYDDSLEINLIKMKFPLLERELNWINEHPYNR